LHRSGFSNSNQTNISNVNDGTLVVNPCNSPEPLPTTFACTHYQQLIHQLVVNILSSVSALEAIDIDLVSELESALPTLDKGPHTGSWGEAKEWKVPDSYGYDFANDTHRHLSISTTGFPGITSPLFSMAIPIPPSKTP
jgi:alpha-L-fucosidase 2